jgi:hypothetical protein
VREHVGDSDSCEEAAVEIEGGAGGARRWRLLGGRLALTVVTSSRVELGFGGFGEFIASVYRGGRGRGATWCDQAAVAPPRPRTADRAGGDGAVTGAEEEEQRSLAESAHEEEGGGRGPHTQSNT